MITKIHGLAGLKGQLGAPLGPSKLIEVDQVMINAFADATGDRQWIHTDVERAQRENGHTIAHGILVLSLIVTMANDVFLVDEPVAINYGFDKVRFIAPVPAGTQLAGNFTLQGVEPRPNGTRALWDVQLTSDDDRVVCAALWWTYYPSLIQE